MFAHDPLHSAPGAPVQSATFGAVRAAVWPLASGGWRFDVAGFASTARTEGEAKARAERVALASA